MHSYKTQVLLLHSEQSTLDRFSASLGNDYSVHLATSGTEALNTLGLTPIHVMVSAQRLPGMSGIEALREARKRSPETLGILIAPEDMSGAEVEALVGRDEVFQVIHGVGTPEKMRRIIDEAVDQLRMNPLPDSANDRSAGPRPRVSPTAPARDPAAARRAAPTAGTDRAAPPAAAAATELVVLSKDEVFLDTVRQALSARQPVHAVDDLREAAKLIADSTSAVLVTDAAVAPRDVEAITTRLRARQPRLVTIVAGRRDDGDQLMDLINSGMVYRFLLKPISPGRARLAIEAAIRRAREEAQPAGADQSAAPAKAAAPAKPAAAAKPKAPPEPAARMEPTLEDFEGAEEVVLSEEAPAPRAPVRAAPASRARARPESGTETDTRPQGKPRREKKAVRQKAGADEPRGKTRRARPARYAARGLGAVAVVAVAAAGAWYALSGDDPSGVAGTPTAGEMPARQAAAEAAPAEPAPPPVSRELRQARAAVAEGRLLAPGEDGALALYARALADASGDSSLAAEVDQVVAEAVAGIAAALDAGRPGEARAARTVVGTHFPAAPGLAAIDRRLAEAERDRLLARADELVAAGDTDSAMAVLDEAASLLPGRSAGVEARRDSILAASDNRGRTLLLELGNQRLLQGQLVEPAADNARYYYRAVLAQDSESIAGRQGMAFLRTALITRIREALEAGDRATAERWLEEARVSGVEEARLTPFSEAAARLPRAPVEDTRPAASETPPPATAVDEPPAAGPAVGTPTGAPGEAPAEAAAGIPAEPAGQTAAGPSEPVDSAERTEAASAEPVAADESLADATPATAEAQPPAAEESPLQRAADETPTEGPEELPAEDVLEAQAGAVEQAPADPLQQLEQPAQTAENPAEPAPTTVAPTDEPAAVEETVPTSEPATAEPSSEPAPDAGEPVADAASPPTRPERITYVPPSYPRTAAMRGTEGWVDVEFSLTTAGEPRAIEVTDASPAGTFDEAAIDAVGQWRYQPPAESGWPEDDRIRIRINFGLDR